MKDSRAQSFSCWNCGGEVRDLPLPLSRHEYCPACAEALHCCRQCRLFAPERADQCLEERAEHPTDRTAANFCDYFQLRESAPAAAGGHGDPDPRARLDALFGAAPAAADKADPRSRLDALFGDSDGDD